MAAHSSFLAWKIPWTEESGRLQSIGLQRVGHDTDIARAIIEKYVTFWRCKHFSLSLEEHQSN